MAKIPSLKALVEKDETLFGQEISSINKWFSKKYDASYSFKWNGSELSVFDADEKEIEKIDIKELSNEIPDFPEKVNESLNMSSAVTKQYGKRYR